MRVPQGWNFPGKNRERFGLPAVVDELGRQPAAYVF